MVSSFSVLQLIIGVPVGTGRVLAMMERKKVENM
jgi:hypothetical protein